MNLNSKITGGSELEEADIFLSASPLTVTTHPGEMDAGLKVAHAMQFPHKECLLLQIPTRLAPKISYN